CAGVRRRAGRRGDWCGVRASSAGGVSRACGAARDVRRENHGARAYVAISGGIETPKVLGSRATHLPSAMGGLDGRALKAGDELPLGSLSGPPDGGHYRRVLSPSVVSGFSRTLRVLPGPQLDRFAAGALDALQSA